MRNTHPCVRIWALCSCGIFACLACPTCRDTHHRLHHKGRRVPRMAASPTHA